MATPEQAAGALKAVGFNDDQALLLTAIAGAESSWRLDAVSPTGDYGVWQINEAAHPDLMSWAKSDDILLHAKAAKSVFDNEGYNAWVAYQNGTYRDFLDQAARAVPNAKLPEPGGPARVTPVGLNPVDWVKDKLFGPAERIAFRILVGGGGFTLALIGIVIILADSKAGKAVTSGVAQGGTSTIRGVARGATKTVAKAAVL